MLGFFVVVWVGFFSCVCFGACHVKTESDGLQHPLVVETIVHILFYIQFLHAYADHQGFNMFEPRGIDDVIFYI